MNPSQLPGFFDLQWLDNLPFPDPLPTFAPPTLTPDPWMLMASMTTWMETQQQILRVIIPLVERLNQSLRPIVSTKGHRLPPDGRLTQPPRPERRMPQRRNVDFPPTMRS